jgi:hypothetical protein
MQCANDIAVYMYHSTTMHFVYVFRTDKACYTHSKTSECTAWETVASKLVRSTYTIVTTRSVLSKGVTACAC